jgi:hypothetical protein
MKQNHFDNPVLCDECWYCDGNGEIETDNDEPAYLCPMCEGAGKRPKCKSLQEDQPCT